jgi:hypothetical protein
VVFGAGSFRCHTFICRLTKPEQAAFDFLRNNSFHGWKKAGFDPATCPMQVAGAYSEKL